MIKDYLLTTKPGIIMGNLIAAISGFLLASQGNVDFVLMLSMAVGTIFVIASGCVINNIFDRDIDTKMSRTKNRAVAAGRIGVQSALVLGVLTGIVGFATLAIMTNWIAVFFAALGFIVYVGVYTMFYKRSSVHGTLIGSLSGACPPVIGYVSVTNGFDIGAAIILLTFCLWQVPHSYAIAIYRFDDYMAAKIPVFPVEQGVEATRKHMIVYIIAFMFAALALAYFGYAGYWYALIIGLGSLYWLYLAKIGYQPDNEQLWARKVFLFSIVIIVAFSVLISVDFISTARPESLTEHIAYLGS